MLWLIAVVLSLLLFVRLIVDLLFDVLWMVWLLLLLDLFSLMVCNLLALLWFCLFVWGWLAAGSLLVSVSFWLFGLL